MDYFTVGFIIILTVFCFYPDYILLLYFIFAITLFAFVGLLIKKANSSQNVSLKLLKYTDFPISNLDSKIVKLGISAFRMVVYLITCVCILAVDFTYFSFTLNKTDKYGISLMDLGVGLFIVCHSLRVIRNSEDKHEKM